MEEADFIACVVFYFTITFVFLVLVFTQYSSEPVTIIIAWMLVVASVHFTCMLRAACTNSVCVRVVASF